MKLIFCKDGKDFLDRFEAALLSQEVVHQLILGNAAAQLDTPLNVACFFGAVLREDDSPIIVFNRRDPFRLLIDPVDTAAPDIQEAVTLLAQHVVDKKMDIPGVLASQSICDAFLSVDTGNTYKQGHGMDIMELREITPHPLSPGNFRLAEEKDIPQLVDWYIAFHEEALGNTLTAEEALPKITPRMATKDFYVYENSEGKPVTMAGVSRRLRLGCCVSNVYTPPEERGKGYCASLMQLLAEERLAAGNTYLGLYVDKANPISNHVYKKIGYRILVDSFEYDRITE